DWWEDPDIDELQRRRTHHHPDQRRRDGDLLRIVRWRRGHLHTIEPGRRDGDTIDGRTLTNVGPFPAISHHGAIAFSGEFAGGKGIFTPSGLVAQTGDTIGGRTLTDVVPFALAINDTGTILFVGSFAGGRGIFTQSALVAQAGDVIDGK